MEIHLTKLYPVCGEDLAYPEKLEDYYQGRQMYLEPKRVTGQAHLSDVLTPHVKVADPIDGLGLFMSSG